jgi:hypothetical protein
MSPTSSSIILTLVAIVTAAAVVVAMRWRRGQPLTARFLLGGLALMAAAVLISVFVSGANLSPAVLKPVLATALLAAAAFEGFYAIKYWRSERWSPLTRQFAFGLLIAVASAIAVLYFL